MIGCEKNGHFVLNAIFFKSRVNHNAKVTRAPGFSLDLHGSNVYSKPLVLKSDPPK